ncbi:MAG: chitobiase/beta-hexosaminidase C-terminal domain-containing protein, partial [Acidobacteriota bacterium]|nr:chitobiase/beta-hexosaminidase C-terminal domain-containing protein [Acidobacteriota bacterium]
MVVTVDTAGATIRYTQNGDEPTETDATVASGGSISVTSSQTLRAKAWKSGMPAGETAVANYTLKVATPTVSPTATTYTTPQNVTMSTTTPGSTLRYTIDGTNPTESSSAYSAAVNTAQTTTYRIIGFKSGWTPSDVRVSTYTMNFGTLAAPTVAPATGSYTGNVEVTMSSPQSGATIRYTTNNTAPTASSPIYSGPLSISTTTTVRAKVFHPDYTASAETSRTYTLTAHTPTLDAAAGSYAPGATVTITAGQPSTDTLRMTVDGGDPTGTSPAIASGTTLLLGNFTLKVRAFRVGAGDSAVAAASYSLTGSLGAGSVAAGGSHTALATPDGRVFVWGLNTNGQLGDLSTTTRATPTVLQSLTGVTKVAAGVAHTLAVTADGRVFAWGNNGSGRLGDGTTTQRTGPTAVPALADVIAVAAGDAHSLALTNDGHVYGWGANASGQLGLGTTTGTSTPTLITSLSDVVAIAAGDTHSLAVTASGQLFTWGANASSRLGDGTTTNRTSPTLIALSDVVAVAAGATHSVALQSNGNVYAWGLGSSGQLGQGSTVIKSTPTLLSSLAGAVSVAAGGDHTIILSADGTVWTVGKNGDGQLGLGTTMNVLTPAQVPNLAGISQIAAGSLHSLAITADNVISTWGRNASSELGDGAATGRSAPETISESDYAWRVAKPTFSIAAGTYSVDQTVVLSSLTPNVVIHYTQDGTEPTELHASVASGGSVVVSATQVLKAKAWKTGVPASGVASNAYTMKVALPTVSPAAATYATPQNVTMATITPGSTLRYTIDGTDPTESSTAYTTAVSVANTTTLRIVGFKSGWTNSDTRIATYTMNFGTLAAPTIDPGTGSYTGDVAVTMSSPQSGATIRYTTNNTAPTASSPIYSGPLSISTTTTVRAKVFHPDYTASAETLRAYTLTTHTPTLGTAAGTYAPGSTVTVTAGQPATDTLRMTIDGSDPSTSSPTIASGTTLVLGSFTLKVKAWRTGATDSDIAGAAYALNAPLGPGSVAAGGTHSIIATPDGRVIAWGENGNGQIGNEGTVDRTTPTTLNTITGVTQVAGGLAHTLARTWDGQVYAWGSNTSGRLGDGTTTQRTRPTLLTTLSNIVAVAAGDAHSLALTSDGAVYAWGLNSSGELGLGSTTSTSTPTLIPVLSGIVAIAAGDAHSLAVTSSGQLYAWGNNGSSRLGDGTTTNRTSPVLINLSNVVSVAAGAAHSLAMTSSGAVYAWGLNTNGQLGLGNTTLKSTPTLIPALHASAIAAGDTHSAALRGDGVLVAWGLNSSGQLGDATTTQRTSPVIVTGPTTVSSLAFGDAHSFVVTPDGDVWTWGAGASGQLGDGGVSNRAAPQSVLAGIAWWMPSAPTVDIPSGTYANTQSVVISSPIPGAVIRYTLTGQEPADSDTEATSGASLDISYSAFLRARAFVDGRAGKVVRADYELQSVAPIIDPPTGTYTSAQTVSMTASGPLSVIRYTTDGSDPTPTSTAYSQPFVVSTSQTLKARAFPTNGWPASGASTASLAFNYGQLSAPTAAPSEGVFADPQTVALAASPGATIRFTTNGADPTAASPIYTSPIAVTTGAVTIKARAYHPDWTGSPVSAQAYTIDVAPPTIVATRFPLPMGNWQLTPVTVGFVCSDSVGIATCSSPAIVSLEGAEQTVSGIAVDHVGREATVQVTVNVDLTPPLVTLTAPADGLVTASSTVAVSAEVGDALSGLGVVNCNGVATAVVDGIVTCTATLRPGRNSITVSAR